MQCLGIKRTGEKQVLGRVSVCGAVCLRELRGLEHIRENNRMAFVLNACRINILERPAVVKRLFFSDGGVKFA